MAFYCRRSRALLHTSCQPGIHQCVSLCRKVFVSVYPPTLWCRPSIVELDSCQKSVGGENDSKVLLTEKMLWETGLCCSLIVKELLRHGWRNICADLFGCCHCLQLLVASSPQRLSHVSLMFLSPPHPLRMLTGYGNCRRLKVTGNSPGGWPVGYVGNQSLKTFN